MLAVDAFFVLMGLAVVGVFALVVFVAVRHWRQKMKRREDMAAWALANGMSFTLDDPHALHQLELNLFRKGDGRGFENVVAGTWEGLDVRVADYWYYEESGENDSKTYSRFSIVLACVEASFPAVRIEKENVLTRLADRLALRDLEFESEEFNRRFEIRAKDTEFAYKLVDARMMEWLMHTAGPHCYEVSGPWVLAYCKQLPVAEVPTLLYAVKGFKAQIPRLVWADYGKAAS